MLRARLKAALRGPPHRHLSTLLTPLAPRVSLHLQAHGYAIVDEAIPPSTAAALRDEIDALHAADHLSANATHMVSASATATFCKRNVLEAELALLPRAVLPSLPALCALADDPTVYASLSVHAPRFTLTEHALKVQRAEGGAACFPVHVDSSPAVDNRVVTALLYLNDGWDADVNGGRLRLYTTPTEVVDVDPVEGRLVLLASTGLHHRVMPAHARRYVVTMWCSGAVRKSAAKAMASMDEDDARVEMRVASKLMEPRFKDMAFRLVLVDEWERSLWEAHGGDVAQEAVEVHRTNLGMIREKLPAVLCRELGLGEGEGEQIRVVEELVGRPGALRDVFQRVAEEEEAKAFDEFIW